MYITFYYNKENNDLLEITGKKVNLQIEGYSKLEENTVDAAKEKHLPYLSVEDENILYIQVGEVIHPMTEEHYITAIYVLTDNGIFYKKSFNPNDVPELTINVSGAKNVKVYSHCNLHGIWKSEISL